MVNFNINIETKGRYLSTNSFLWIVSDIRKIFEESIVESILEDYEEFDENKLKKLAKGKIDFYISDFEKGSFIFWLIGGLGYILGVIFTELMKDITKENDLYKALIEKVNSPAKKIAQKFEKKVTERKRVGPYALDNYEVNIKRENKKIDIECKFILNKPDTPDPATDADEQIIELINNIKKTFNSGDDNSKSK